MIFIEFLKALPRFFCWVLAFLFGSAIYLGDKIAYLLLFYSRRTEFVRRGGCARTGQCCRNLALQVPNAWARRPWIVKIFNAWYRAIFNFHYLGTINQNWLVYECHYLKNGNLCSIYPYRPKLCREFPLTPLFGHGNLHKGCGYYFLQRGEIGKFREKLVEKEHEAERQAYLFQGFQKPFGEEEGLGAKGYKNQGARK
jgi:Fe-S-cluster containining protein